MSLDHTVPGSVVIVTCEDGIGDTIRPRLEEAGADLTRCRVVQTVPVPDQKGEKKERVPIIPEDIPSIEKAVRQMGACLLIIDPLFAHLSSKTNSFRDQDIRAALTPLVQMGEKLGVAILVIRHLNKSVGGPAMYRGGGSIGVTGQARFAFLLGRNPEDEDALVLALLKANIAKRNPSLALRVVSSTNDPSVGVIKWEGESTFKAQELVSAPATTRTTKVDEAAGWLEDQLDDGEWHLATAVWKRSDEAGLTETTVRRAKKKLRVEVKQLPPGPKNPWYWRLPNNEDSAGEFSPSNGADKKNFVSPDGQFSTNDHLESKKGVQPDKMGLNGHKMDDLDLFHQVVNGKAT